MASTTRSQATGSVRSSGIDEGRAQAERASTAADAQSGDDAGSRTAAVADRLIRRMRVSDPPERFQARAVAALREALDVPAVAWIPASAREPVVLAGGIEGMNPESFRALAGGPSPEDSARVPDRDRSRDSAVPAVRSLSVPATAGDRTCGWLVAADRLEQDLSLAFETDLLRTVASLVAAQRANSRLYNDLKELFFGVIRSLTAAIDAKDPYTSGHSERVARIAVRLGQELGMSANAQGDLYLMGLLHDVGKIGIEDGVLKKPGKLTPEEYQTIQSHVKIGVHILRDLKKLHHLLPGVKHHHESLDGSGYPSGLRGDAIPLPARILAVADAFDAMSSSRPYRQRMSPSQIDEIFREGMGVQWDSRVVNALFSCREPIDHIREKGLGESLQQVIDETLGRG